MQMNCLRKMCGVNIHGQVKKLCDQGRSKCDEGSGRQGGEQCAEIVWPRGTYGQRKVYMIRG